MKIHHSTKKYLIMNQIISTYKARVSNDSDCELHSSSNDGCSKIRQKESKLIKTNRNSFILFFTWKNHQQLWYYYKTQFAKRYQGKNRISLSKTSETYYAISFVSVCFSFFVLKFFNFLYLKSLTLTSTLTF